MTEGKDTYLESLEPAGTSLEGESQNPYVFIVGCPRSGTTLLERMVNTHSMIAITHETHWITRYYKKRIGLTRDGFVTPELITRLLDNHRFSRLGIDSATLEKLARQGNRIPYAEFVSHVFDLYVRREGKFLAGDKTTGGYIRNIPVLHALWPQARVVHLVRDGRDVCLSMLTWPKAHRAAGRFKSWRDDPVSTTALWWKWHVSLGCKDGRSLGPNLYHEMRFEALVEHPEDECARLCSFLGLPYEDRMPLFHEGRTANDPGLSANQAWLPPTKGLRNWQSQMPRHDVELFNAIAGDLLSELGYERGVETISPEVAGRSASCARKWESEMARPRA